MKEGTIMEKTTLSHLNDSKIQGIIELLNDTIKPNPNYPLSDGVYIYNELNTFLDRLMVITNDKYTRSIFGVKYLKDEIDNIARYTQAFLGEGRAFYCDPDHLYWCEDFSSNTLVDYSDAYADHIIDGIHGIIEDCPRIQGEISKLYTTKPSELSHVVSKIDEAFNKFIKSEYKINYSDIMSIFEEHMDAMKGLDESEMINYIIDEMLSDADWTETSDEMAAVIIVKNKINANDKDSQEDDIEVLVDQDWSYIHDEIKSHVDNPLYNVIIDAEDNTARDLTKLYVKDINQRFIESYDCVTSEIKIVRPWEGELLFDLNYYPHSNTQTYYDVSLEAPNKLSDTTKSELLEYFKVKNKQNKLIKEKRGY